ncbi:MAG TPA: response regulator [Candidatus Solibacter sp.]|nr:response regulator [Candidatus Solibacter sp.]
MQILVVEDEIRQQEWLTRNLSNAEHEVTTACDGDWAFTHWKIHGPFGVVVTANRFGGKTLPSCKLLIGAIRAIDPGQPFIMQAFVVGADRPRGVPLLPKPCSTKRLLLEISRAHRQRLPLYPFDPESL